MALTFEKLKQMEGVEAVGKPEHLQKKSGLQKAGEFIAPTTTGLLTGEKELTPRTAFGAALEVGSFAVPAGAVLRGASIGARVLSKVAPAVSRVPKAVQVAKKAPEITTFEGLRAKTGQVTSRLGRSAKEGAIVGGVAGTAFGAGRALGEEDLSLREVAGEAAISGVFGAVGGAALVPAISGTTMAAKSVVGLTRRGWGSATARLNPQARTAAVDDVARSIEESVLQREPLLQSLREIGKSAGFKGLNAERDAIKMVVDEGYMPSLRGKVFGFPEQKFSTEAQIADVARRQKGLSDAVSALAKNIKETTSIVDLEKAARQRLQGRIDIDPEKVSKQISALFQNLRAEFKTGKLSGEQVDLIRKRATQATKSFQKEQFIEDAQNAIRSVSRSRLDALDDRITKINAENSKLFRVKEVLEALDGQRVDIGMLSSGVGRFMGVLSGGAVGLSAGFGPGGLVIAGLLAGFGQRIVANMIRQYKFNPQLQEVIRRGLRSDKKLLDKFIREATPADAALLRKVAGQRALSMSMRTPTKTVANIPTKNAIGKRTTRAIPPRTTKTPRNVPIAPSVPTPRQPVKSPAVRPKGQGGAPETAAARTAVAFDKSTAQKSIGPFEIGTFGNNALERKVGQTDRLPRSELKKTIDNIVEAYKAGDDPFRAENIVWLSKVGSQLRAVITRQNSRGKEEVINFFKVGRDLEKFIDNLKSFGAPSGSRTRNLLVRTESPDPLGFRGTSNVPSRGGLSRRPVAKPVDAKKANVSARKSTFGKRDITLP